MANVTPAALVLGAVEVRVAGRTAENWLLVVDGAVRANGVALVLSKWCFKQWYSSRTNIFASTA